jgi:hypothetical protein
MSTIIKLKRSETGAAVPAPADLETGEVALNTVDKKIYTKTSGAAVVEIANGIDTIVELTDVTNAGTVGQILKKVTASTYAFSNYSPLDSLTVTTNAAGSPSLAFDGTSTLTYTPPEFEGLGDVDTSTSTSTLEQMMISDGDGTYSFQDNTIANHKDVDIVNLNSGNILAWNPFALAGQGAWVPAVNPAELISVSVAAPGTPNLSYNTSTKVMAYTPPDFEGLSDVDTATSTSTANMRMVSDGDGTYSFKDDTIVNLNDVTNAGTVGQVLKKATASTYEFSDESALEDLTITTAAAGSPSLAFDGVSTLTYTPPTLAGVSDTNITTPANGQILVYNSTSSLWENVNGSFLEDITVTTNAAGSPALTYDGTSAFTYTPPNFEGLSDVDTSTATNTAAMRLRSDGDGTYSFVNDTLGALTDVTYGGTLAANDFLVFSGTSWVKTTIRQLSALTITTAAAGSPSLSFNGTDTLTYTPPNFAGLDDTNFTSLTAGEHLQWDGTDWVNVNVTPTVTNDVTIGEVLKYDTGTSTWTAEDLYGASSQRIKREVVGSDIIYTFA